VHSRDDERSWSLRADTVETVGHNAARIPLSKCVLSRSTRRARQRGSIQREPLTLSVPGNLDDMDVHVFPILDIGATHCSVETSTPLEPGRAFATVEVQGARRVLRRIAATVVDAVPWYMPDGTQRFRCRLVFRPGEKDEKRERLYDLITEPDKVRRVLQLATLVNTRGWYEANSGQRGSVTLSSLDQASLTLRSIGKDAVGGERTQLRVGFELFTIGYEMEVRRVTSDGGTHEVSLPLILRRRQWRREHRVLVTEPGSVTVRFTAPNTGARVTRPVLDLSFGGMSFEMDRESDVLWSACHSKTSRSFVGRSGSASATSKYALSNRTTNAQCVT
jgi:hypothetical protein